MRLVAFETSTARVSVAFIDEEAGREETRTFDGAGRLSQVLMPTLIELERAAWPVAAADLIVCGRGPGSFTGLRVGMAAAKGFAGATGVPVIAASSLAAVAVSAGRPGRVVAVLDARGGYYYFAIYEVSPHGVEEVAPPAIGDGPALAALPEDTFVGPLRPAGFGKGERRVLWLEVWPRAAVSARLGAAAFRRRGPDELATLRPLYLKRGQA